MLYQSLKGESTEKGNSWPNTWRKLYNPISTYKTV